jgi:PAS domain S-box-containing protein/putative nucleotidyltransferase with HDIG domain
MGPEEPNKSKVKKGSSQSINQSSPLRLNQYSIKILNTLPLGIIILVDNKIVFCNQHFCQLSGYEVEELIRKNLVELISEVHIDEVEKKVSNINHNKSIESFQFQLKRKNVDKIWVMARIAQISINSFNAKIICLIDINQQKETEAALIESEQKWKMMCDAAFEAIAIHRGWKICEANKQFANLFGYNENEIKDINLLDLAYPEDKELVRQKILDKDESLYEARGVKKNGEIIFGQLRSKSIQYKGNEARLTVINDITKFKETEEGLKKSEKKYRDLVENAIVGIYQIDMEGNLIYANDALAKMVGFDSVEQLKEYKIHKESEIKKAIMDFAEELKKSGGVLRREIHFTTINGESKDVLLSAYIDGENICGMFQDLSEERLAAEAVKESEERYKMLFERVPIGLYRTTPSGKLLEVNQAFIELLGYKSKEEVLKKNAVEFYVNPEDRKRWQDIIHKEGMVKRFTAQMRRADGSIIWVNEHTHLVKEKDGVILYYEGSIEDITELKITEEKNKRNYEMLKQILEGTVNALSVTAEKRDPYTAGHQQRVTQLACAIAEAMGLSEQQIESIRLAGTLHDIGKIYIPAEILIKPGPLSIYEINLIRAHVQIGYEILKMVPFQLPVAKIVLQHHEKMDGSGYPAGISGDDLLLEARILAVADVVEAMASNRPYRSAHGIKKALEEIANNAGKLYDPNVVKTCIELFETNKFSFSHLP